MIRLHRLHSTLIELFIRKFAINQSKQARRFLAEAYSHAFMIYRFNWYGIRGAILQTMHDNNYRNRCWVSTKIMSEEDILHELKESYQWRLDRELSVSIVWNQQSSLRTLVHLPLFCHLRRVKMKPIFWRNFRRNLTRADYSPSRIKIFGITTSRYWTSLFYSTREHLFTKRVYVILARSCIGNSLYPIKIELWSPFCSIVS